MDFLDTVDFTAVEEDPFGQGCFSCVNMGADAQIPHFFVTVSHTIESLYSLVILKIFAA